MLLTKLKALHLYLKQANLVPQEHIDSWADSIQLIPNSKKLGHGIRICACEYKAIYVIERYKKAPEWPLVLVSIWLQENDPKRADHKLANPTVEIDLDDEHTADINIEVSFREDVELVEDVDGPFTYDGKTWRIEGVDISYAETGTLYSSDEGTPITEEDIPDGALVSEEEFVLIIEDED
jgi:hypothetical protein